MARKKSFSTKMAELEDIVEKLHSDIDLEDALKIYESGMVLAKELKQYLEKAEEKIRVISQNGEESEVLPENLGRKIDK